MSLQLVTAKCCAIQEVHGISTFTSPEETLAAFCQLNLQSEGQVRYRSAKANVDSLYSFYFFSGPVYHENRWDYNTPWDTKKAYVFKLASYIIGNQLGEVSMSPLRVNEAFHKDHANQMCIWAPDIKALKKWWAKYQKDHAKEQPDPGE